MMDTYDNYSNRDDQNDRKQFFMDDEPSRTFDKAELMVQHGSTTTRSNNRDPHDANYDPQNPPQVATNEKTVMSDQPNTLSFEEQMTWYDDDPEDPHLTPSSPPSRHVKHLPIIDTAGIAIVVGTIAILFTYGFGCMFTVNKNNPSTVKTYPRDCCWCRNLPEKVLPYPCCLEYQVVKAYHTYWKEGKVHHESCMERKKQKFWNDKDTEVEKQIKNAEEMTEEEFQRLERAINDLENRWRVEYDGMKKEWNTECDNEILGPQNPDKEKILKFYGYHRGRQTKVRVKALEYCIYINRCTLILGIVVAVFYGVLAKVSKYVETNLNGS